MSVADHLTHHVPHGPAHGEHHRASSRPALHLAAPLPPDAPSDPEDARPASPAPGRVRALPVPVAEPHPLVSVTRARRSPPGQQELPLQPAAPALREAGRGGTTPSPDTVPGVRLLPARPVPVRSLPGVRRGSREAEFWLPRPTSAVELPDPEQLCATLARAVVEVHSGVRPASQLLRWFTADLYAALQRRAALGTRIRRERAPTRRVAVRRVAVCEPRDGVVEASVVLQDHERVRAVALRLEGWDGRWRVTQLEMG